MNHIEADQLRELLDPLDCADVECDGMARLVCTVLAKHQIEHTVYAGQLLLDGNTVRPHLWVEVGPLLIDYRARMWLGTSEHVPHGVSLKADLLADYQGESITMPALPPHIFSLLAMPRPAELMRYFEQSAENNSRKFKGLS